MTAVLFGIGYLLYWTCVVCAWLVVQLVRLIAWTFVALVALCVIIWEAITSRRAE